VSLKQILKTFHNIRYNFIVYRVDTALFLPNSLPLVHTLWLTNSDASLCRSFGTPGSVICPLVHSADFSYFPTSFYIKKILINGHYIAKELPHPWIKTDITSVCHHLFH